MLHLMLLVFAFAISAHADNCGISPSLERYAIYNSDKILGGENAKDGDWPWYALLHSGTYACGSTIISDQWILTAGHCIYSIFSPASIRYGSVNRSAGEIAYAEEIFIHPGYVLKGLINDITLIKLNQTLNFSENVHPICLNRSVELHSGEILAQAGFGKEFIQFRPNITYTNPSILQDSPIAYLGNSTELCNVEICVGGINHAALPGDSGGPLMAIRDDRWVQVGVASSVRPEEFRNESISMNGKNFYTRIATYCDWIEETTNHEVTC